MKIVVLSVVFAVGLKSAIAQIPSSCNLLPGLQTSYDADVKHIAYQRIVAQNSTYKDSVVINQAYQDTVWEGLASIYNLTTIPERDSVFDSYCIHQDIKTISNNIYVGVNPSYTWTQNWQGLNTSTGIAAMDSMLAKYGFTVTYYSSFTNYARLTTTQNINVQPICDSLESFGGVLYSEPQIFAGDGNRVEYSSTGGNRMYQFSVGYGDCPSGCTSRRTFVFKVYPNCSVDFIGTINMVSGNDIMPGPVNCNATVGLHDSPKRDYLGVYPNPNKGEFRIFAGKWENKELALTVIDILGKEVLNETKRMQGNEATINCTLNPGTYLIKAIDLQSKQVLTGDLLIVK